MATQANGVAKTTPISSFQFTVHSVNPNGGKVYLPEGKIGFTEVSGLSKETEALEYKEGNDLYGRNLPGRTKAGSITLRRGLDLNNYFIGWRDGIEERTALPTGTAVNDVIITIYDRRGAPGASETVSEIYRIIRLRNAWPSTMEIGDLSGTAGDINIQSVTLVHDGPYEILYPLADQG